MCKSRFLVIFLSYFLFNQVAAEEYKTDYYHVKDGDVDEQTFMGWSVYHYACVSCHGVAAKGTDVAPDLTEKIKSLSPAEFEAKVLRKYLVSMSREQATGDNTAVREAFMHEIRKQQAREKGDMAAMPKWENSPVVKDRTADLYSYLKARADGALGEGRPDIIKQ